MGCEGSSLKTKTPKKTNSNESQGSKSPQKLVDEPVIVTKKLNGGPIIDLVIDPNYNSRPVLPENEFQNLIEAVVGNHFVEYEKLLKNYRITNLKHVKGFSQEVKLGDK